MLTPGWMNQAGIKMSGKNINNLRYTDPNGREPRGVMYPVGAHSGPAFIMLLNSESCCQAENR